MDETLTPPARTVTLGDIEHFADFTGDRFYADMDDDAAGPSFGTLLLTGRTVVTAWRLFSSAVVSAWNEWMPDRVSDRTPCSR